MTKPQRVTTLLLAILFLATSIAFSVFVVLDMREQSNDTTSTQSQTDPLPTNEQNEENNMLLQGTKLEGFTPLSSVAELQKIDLQEGSGEEVRPGASVTAHYTGALAQDGTIFQSSHDSGSPVPFGLDEVISGWTEGVPGMKVGGKRRLVIPAAKAYGDQSRPGIPPNSDLVFDIEIVSVEQ